MEQILRHFRTIFKISGQLLARPTYANDHQQFVVAVVVVVVNRPLAG